LEYRHHETECPALVALTLTPVYAIVFGRTAEAIAFAVLGVLGWWQHRANIQRLIAGTEPRLGQGSR